MTQSKRCGSCKQSRTLTEFNRRAASVDGLQTLCKDCNREQARAYYARNRGDHVRRIVAAKAARRERALGLVARHLLAHPCIDCGEADIRVLDFDHRDGAEKSAEVMRLAQHGHALRRVEAEIAKCDVRCRNCHAIVTYERLGDNWRSALRQRTHVEVEAFLLEDDIAIQSPPIDAE